MLTYLILFAGLLLLFFGGDWLVKGASAIATRFGVSPMIVGLTIVGFGTSTPELLVSLQAAWNHELGIAIGNVIGSNIANILLIGGLTALVAPMLTPFAELRRNLLVMIAATLALPLILWSGAIGPIEGVCLLTGLGLFLYFSLRGSRSDVGDDDIVHLPIWQSLLAVAIGLVALMIGAKWLVASATDIARTFGVSEAMIGLSVVAVGTSLPELATSIVAAMRGQREIAIGNIIGSNIFNILFILGITALIAPIPVDPRFLPVDTPVAIAATVFMAALVALRGEIGRIAGVVMLVSYFAYMAMTSGL